jgi:hypothetical protein
MFLGSKPRPVREARVTSMWADCLDNVESATSNEPKGLHSLFTVILYFKECRLPGCYAVWLFWEPTLPHGRNIPEDDILHSHSRENLKSYIVLTGWAL